MASTDPNKKPKSTPELPPHAELVEPVINEDSGEAFVDFGTVAPIHEGASGVVPLDELPVEVSDQSMTSWTEVIRRQRAAEAAVEPTPLPVAEAVRVDSPSDRDLLAKDVFSETDRPSTGGSSKIPLAGIVNAQELDTHEIPEADLPVVVPQATEASDHGKAQIGTGFNTSNSSSDVWADAKGVPDDIDSIPLDDDGSSAMLGNMPLTGTEGTRSSILDVLLSESNLELPVGEDNSPDAVRSMMEDLANSPSKIARPTDPGLELPQDQMKFPSLPSLGTMPVFQLDALPAGLEEGTTESRFGDQIIDLPKLNDSDDSVDLYSEQFPQPSITDSGSLEISDKAVEESERKQRIIESSTVDLNSRPSLYDGNLDVDDIPPIVALPDDEESKIDMNPPASGGLGKSSIIRPIEMDTAAPYLPPRPLPRSGQGSSTMNLRPQPKPEKNWRSTLYSAVAGSLVGAGAMFGAFNSGIFSSAESPTSKVKTTTEPDYGELTKAKEEANVARKDLADLKASIDKALDNLKLSSPEKGLASIPVLLAERNNAVTRMMELTNEAKTLKEKADLASKAETAAKEELKSAQTALATSEAKLTEASKSATDANNILATVGKSFKDAGLDASKPAEVLRDLLAKKSEAEKLAKEAEAKVEKATKEYAAKLETASKQLTEATKASEEARKSAVEAKAAAEEVAKAKAAADNTLKSLGEKLAKAKYVGANADAAAILKGLDDAIKAGSTDATSSLREELVKLRDVAAKSKADLDSLTIRQQNTEKLAKAAEQQAKAAADELKAVTTKYQAEVSAAKQNSDKLSLQLTELKAKSDVSLAKANEAEKLLAKSMSELNSTKEQLGGQIAKLKSENDSLSRDLASVKELSLAIKNQAGSRDPVIKADPSTIADKFFANAARAFHSGSYAESESNIVKGIAIFGDDARYHYLLGLALYNQGKTKEAATAFNKGAELESQGRPNGKSIDAVLERVQGNVRQVVNSYRP